MPESLVVICCSVLEKEFMAVFDRRPPDVELVFLDSMLHMEPVKLQKAMEAVISEKKGRPVLIVYGDCHAHMNRMERLPHCVKTRGVNCGELLLGRDLYKACRNEQAFLFLPEWTARWREVFEKKLGFHNASLAQEFIKEYTNSLVYLDTGIEPVPEQTLGDISDYFGMPVEILSVSLDHFHRTVTAALEEIEGDMSREP